MRIALAADHAGFPLKQELLSHLSGQGLEIVDLGTHGTESVDYPDFARAVAEELLDRGADRGVLVCGSGVGASVAANKFPGIRAGLSHDIFSARQGVEDDDANVICLGARVIGVELAKDLVDAFLSAEFQAEPRYVRRLDKLREIERAAAERIAEEGSDRR